MTSSTDLRVSARAAQDIAAILNYTRKTWGTGQEDAYASIIRNAFQRIQAFPEIGRRASEDRPGVRQLVLEYHTIVYRYRDNRVTILRVVNPRRRRSRKPAPKSS